MIGVLGINHKTASLEVREKFSISPESILELGELILNKTAISETVILSTCNRTEIYYYHKAACIGETAQSLNKLLHKYKKVDTDHSRFFYSYSNYEAVNHLFSVTSGVDSMVVGEDQIVSQVKNAYLTCTNFAFTDAVLMRMFQKSFETGKKVRSETDIQKGASSISFVAVDKCINELKSGIKNKKVFIIGTGKTSRLVIEKLKKQGVSKFLFTNRTFEKAQQFAEVHNGFAIEFKEFKRYLNDYDIIITATGAGTILIDNSDISNKNEQVFIDLAVPRNISKNINHLENKKLITIDSLQEDLDKVTSQRLESKTNAGLIIDEMTTEYFTWLENRALRPVIKSITENIQKVHENELENSSTFYSPEMLKIIEEYSGRLTNKYIRTFIKKLKELNENSGENFSLQTIIDLFEFDSEIPALKCNITQKPNEKN